MVSHRTFQTNPFIQRKLKEHDRPGILFQCRACNPDLFEQEILHFVTMVLLLDFTLYEKMFFNLVAFISSSRSEKCTYQYFVFMYGVKLIFNTYCVNAHA